MTPAARIAATIELLDEVTTAPLPADEIVRGFFRTRRYIGAKDRQAIGARLYTILRHRARLVWWLAALDIRATPRAEVLAQLVLVEGASPAAVVEWFSGGQYSPAALEAREQELVAVFASQPIEPPQMDLNTRVECPDWAAIELRALFGERFEAELRALCTEAPLDLRVNTLKASRPQVLAVLQESGIDCAPTAVSPLGIRISGRQPLHELALFRDGWVEVQDESSQIAALLVDAQPGHAVVDFCAGAGGKTLALAARMGNKGRIVACDVIEPRLARARPRLARAGVDTVLLKPLRDERDTWVKRNAGKFDRVLVDAPCSGTGAWRRNPDMRWNRTHADLEELRELQARILHSAIRLVKPGGRLLYATCSLLPAENEAQITHLLAEHPTLTVLSAHEVWDAVHANSEPSATGGALPTAASPFLRLSPAISSTDGFFCAILAKSI